MELPQMKWFMDSSTNPDGPQKPSTYTGSLRADTTKPCFDVPSFNYKVTYRPKEDNPDPKNWFPEMMLVARCNRTESAADKFAVTDLGELICEGTAEDLAKINEWLDQRYEEGMK